MANISAADVNKLRQMTGVGMMDCKKALVECDGDFDKAIDFLRQKGQKLAAKRAERDANEGVVLAKANGSFLQNGFIRTNPRNWNYARPWNERKRYWKDFYNRSFNSLFNRCNFWFNSFCYCDGLYSFNSY